MLELVDHEVVLERGTVPGEILRVIDRPLHVLHCDRRHLRDPLGERDRINADAIKAQRERGYRRVVLAGQSFGGRVTLEVGASIELFAAVAFAPGMENTVGNTRTQAQCSRR